MKSFDIDDYTGLLVPSKDGRYCYTEDAKAIIDMLKKKIDELETEFEELEMSLEAACDH
jgi:predicted transcriptional regulator